MFNKLNLLKDEITKIEMDLRQIAANYILEKKENTKEFCEVMSKIELISELNNSMTSTSQLSDSQNHVMNPENQYSLDSDFRSKHLEAVYINGIKYKAKYLRDVARIICEYLLNTHYQQLISSFEVAVTPRGEKCISCKRDDLNCKEPDEIKSANGSIYIDSYRLATNKMTTLKKLLEYIGIDDSTIVIEVNENYERKRRNSTKQTA